MYDVNQVASHETTSWTKSWFWKRNHLGAKLKTHFKRDVACFSSGINEQSHCSVEPCWGTKIKLSILYIICTLWCPLLQFSFLPNDISLHLHSVLLVQGHRLLFPSNMNDQELYQLISILWAPIGNQTSAASHFCKAYIETITHTQKKKSLP